MFTKQERLIFLRAIRNYISNEITNLFLNSIQIKNNWRKYFIPESDSAVLTVFLSLCLFRAWFKTQSVHADLFETLLPSEATFNRFDIGARVKLFYSSVMFLLVSFFLVQNVLKLLFHYFTKPDRAYKRLFVVPSLIGMVCILSELFEIKAELTLIFILVLLALLIGFYKPLKIILPDLSFSLKIIFILSLSVSLSCFFSRLLHLFSETELIPAHWLFAICWGIIVGGLIILNKKTFTTKRILYSALPVLLLGIWVVAS